MISIDCRFLRKAWYIILENFSGNLSEFKNELAQQYSMIEMEKELLINELWIAEDKLDFDDPEERAWFDTGLSDGNQTVKIRYRPYPEIIKNIKIVCHAIEMKMLVTVPRKPKRGTSKRAQGRFVQENLHQQLQVVERDDRYLFENAKIKIHPEVVTNIIHLAIQLLNRNPDRTIQVGDDLIALKLILSEFTLFKNQIRDANNTIGYDKIWSDHATFWKTENLKSNIAQSKWFCFRRTDAKKSEGSGFGISISPLEIKKYGSGRHSIYMLSKYSDTEHNFDPLSYIGLVTIDKNSKDLVIEMHQERKNFEQPTVAFFVMRITGEKNQKLALGYLTYYSLLSHRYITKVAVWIKMEYFTPSFFKHDKHSLPSIDNFGDFAIDLNPIDNEEHFREIPIEIRKFLSERKQNRLTLPEDTISHLHDSEHSLRKWLTPKYERADDETLKACCGSYEIYYYYGDPITDEISDIDLLQYIRQDTLEFCFDENATTFRAKYTHKRNDPGTTYHGSVSKRNAVVEVVVEFKDNFKYKTIDRSIIYLSFSVPTSEKMAFAKEIENITYFEGLVSGVNDRMPAPISFLILLRKRLTNNSRDNFDSKNPEGTVTAEVLDFFKSNKGNLRIEAEPYGNDFSKDLIFQVSNKGYGCILNEDKRLVIFDRSGTELFSSPKRYTSLQKAVLDNESTLRSL